jgi:hypothetical protein
VVLSGHRRFAQRLLAEAGLPVGDEVEVATQVYTSRGKFVDLQLLALGDGVVRARLWSEHKTGSAYSPGQLPGYAAELAALGGRHQLITIVPKLSDAPVDARWRRYTWRDVAVLAWEVGRDEVGQRWRTLASAEDAPARIRLLHELLSYLEEDHRVVLNPLSHRNLVALAGAGDTSSILAGLLERAGDLSTLDPAGEVDWTEDASWYWLQFRSSGSWADALEGVPELHVAGEDEWAYNRLGEPAFGAGLTLPGRYYDELRDSRRQAWRESVEARGFSLGRTDDDYTRLFRTLYVAELIAKGATLDAQAQALARWTEESVRLLGGSDPQVSPTPATRRRKPRGEDDQSV